MKNQHWSEINEATSVAGIKFLFFVYRTLGRTVFNVFLFPVIVYYFCFQPRARRASRDYLARVQKAGGLPPEASLRLYNIRHFFSFGSGLLDKLAAWSGGVRTEQVKYERYLEFLNTVRSGRGVLLIASHLGNLDISRVMADTHKRVTLNILVHTKHAESFNRILREVDEASCLNLIQVTEVTPATAVMLNEKVQAGEVVVIAGDRTPIGGNGRHAAVNFLGDTALLPQGPYILASILRCSVYLIFCLRNDDHFRVTIEPFADEIRLSRRNRDGEAQLWAQRFADRLSQFALREPLQWFNFYDFWWRPERETSAMDGHENTSIVDQAVDKANATNNEKQ